MKRFCENGKNPHGLCELAVYAQKRTRLSALTNASPVSIGGVLIAILMLWVVSTAGFALAAEPKTMGSASNASLDEQVQEVKSNVLSIAAELNNLEERLLYPSNTQVALFVSLADGQPLELDSARISIDGELVSQHIYSFKELEALEKGGVQRIYTGNVRTGEHRLEVSISGKRSAGRVFETAESFVFDKEVAPKLLGITLADESLGGATISIKNW
jgi:hypothetical protein